MNEKLKIYDALAPIFGGERLNIDMTVYADKDGGTFSVNIDCIDEGEEYAAIEKAESALKEIGAEDLKHGENRCRVWIVGNI